MSIHWQHIIGVAPYGPFPDSEASMDEMDTGQSRERIDRVDRALAGLEVEVARLRAEVASLRGAPKAPIRETVAAEPTRRVRPRTSVDFEKLIGRYGTVAIATLAILLGVGAFLQWAIARGLLGPEMRVLLGAVAAFAVAATGMRLRRRGSARFGNMLLALALAILHVDAWAAGPNLHLVSSAVAQAIAAAASAVLAMLALAEREEPLFAVGLGGALLAPFVTSDGSGSIPMLLAFGWVVTTAAIIARRDPSWRVSGRLLIAFAVIYVMAAWSGLGDEPVAASLRLPAVFAGATAVSALVFGEPTGRRALTRWLLALMAYSIFVAMTRGASEWALVVLAVIGTLTVHAMRRRAEATPEAGGDSRWDAVVLPLAFLFVAMLTPDDATALQAGLTAGPWIVLSAALAVTSPADQRARHLTVLLTALQLAVLFGARSDALPLVLGSAALACVAAFTIRRQPADELLIPLGLGLLVATVASFSQLLSRTWYVETPFFTRASLETLAAVGAWIVTSRIVPSALFGSDPAVPSWRTRPDVALLRSSGAIAAFLWGRAELGQAFSAEIATFLLISFYAAVGVAVIGVGRTRGVAGLRHIGLALALFGALKAVGEANDLSAIGLRVGSYLVVGVFLLGVGYWYRAGAASESAASG